MKKPNFKPGEVYTIIGSRVEAGLTAVKYITINKNLLITLWYSLSEKESAIATEKEFKELPEDNYYSLVSFVQSKTNKTKKT